MRYFKDRGVLEEYLEALYRNVLEFYKFCLPLSPLNREAFERIIKKMLEPPKGFFKEFTSEELGRAIKALTTIDELLKELKDLIDEASRYLITKKSFNFEESWVLKGAIVWPTTIKNIITFRPPVVATYTKALSEPEYKLLRSVMRLITVILRRCREDLELSYSRVKSTIQDYSVLTPKGFRVLTDYVLIKIDELINELRKLEESYPLRYIQTPLSVDWGYINRLKRTVSSKPWRPRWVEELINVLGRLEVFEEELKGILNIIDTIYRKPKEGLRDVSRFVRFLAFRLYEAYTYMLIVRSIVNVFRGSVDGVVGRGIKVIYDHGRSLIVVYGGRLKDSIIAEGKAHWLFSEGFEVPLKELAGRPDIGVVDGAKVVVEAKFSNSASYLTQARFKVIAYLYEYNADTAILVYPGPITSRSIDTEESKTVKLLKKANEKGGIRIELKTGKKLYIIPLPPTETTRNIEKLERIFKEILQPNITT